LAFLSTIGLRFVPATAQIVFELVPNHKCSQIGISALRILAIANRFLPAPPCQAHAVGARLTRASGRSFLSGLAHELQRLDAPSVKVRIVFKRLCAKRTTKRNHPFAMLDSGEPSAARNGVFADGALDESDFDIAGIKLTHATSQCYPSHLLGWRARMTPLSTRSI
jgi:hypothetical protein